MFVFDIHAHQIGTEELKNHDQAKGKDDGGDQHAEQRGAGREEIGDRAVAGELVHGKDGFFIFVDDAFVVHGFDHACAGIGTLIAGNHAQTAGTGDAKQGAQQRG